MNCLNLNRKTTFDQVEPAEGSMLEEGEGDQEEVNMAPLLVMDNARIHHADTVVKALDNYNVLFLPPYSPYLNPIELWFGELKKYMARSYFSTPLQLRKGIILGAKQIPPSFYGNTYRRLLRVCYEAFHLQDLK